MRLNDDLVFSCLLLASCDVGSSRVSGRRSCTRGRAGGLSARPPLPRRPTPAGARQTPIDPTLPLVPPPAFPHQSPQADLCTRQARPPGAQLPNHVPQQDRQRVVRPLSLLIRLCPAARLPRAGRSETPERRLMASLPACHPPRQRHEEDPPHRCVSCRLSRSSACCEPCVDRDRWQGDADRADSLRPHHSDQRELARQARSLRVRPSLPGCPSAGTAR